MSELLLFRFDASSEMGIGHAFRCMALIEQLSLQDRVQCLVIAKPPPQFIVDRLNVLQASLVLLEVDISTEVELAVIEKECSARSAKAIVLDGYQFTQDYRKSLFSLGLNVIVFDDCNDLERLFCHLVINALPFAYELGYEHSAPTALHLLGLDYSIIRHEYLIAKSLPFQSRDKLLINFGGSDIADLTLPLIKKLMAAELVDTPEDIIIITGGAYAKQSEVAKLSALGGFTHIHNCTNMSEVLPLCKMAICAPGSIVYELAFCGVPSLFLTVADNQLLSAKAHQELGWCKVENGLKRQGMDNTLDHLISLWPQEKVLEKMSSRANYLIDGKGVKRICDEIKGLLP
ncbi:UDP-2,4-diacetamido-2,4,6-trideoxy-beta-L-altropyranose hydrolase [Psychromonas sp. SA13A]|uniref:UDP-2,4-diacetamido-2,4, 6-trideoxy-beta-L-altropyranose hydrolase n=1 Tax=Psychromonas sp. SA13A TaxID=2686346 RepID=UPI00140ACCBB|nr:UDP-2,4-diacetamido-2,4,6-trideoxy-beta-L-altropyranose hydrolase [Psychromonas sp. SA13A]